ncbi:MAG: hypothetical protein WC627_10670 [Legionella sp.]
MKKILLVVFIIALPLFLSNCSSNSCSGGGCGGPASGDGCCGSNSYTGNWY